MLPPARARHAREPSRDFFMADAIIHGRCDHLPIYRRPMDMAVQF
jgi:hypothetical protein